MAVGSKLQLEPGSWAEAGYEIIIGAAVGAWHSIYLISRWWYLQLFRPLLRAFGFQLAETEVQTNKEKTLKVVSVGYGRTGTVR